MAKEKKMSFLVCQECKYCLTTEESNLPQCPKCGSINRKKVSTLGLKKLSKKATVIYAFVIVFCIGLGAYLIVWGINLMFNAPPQRIWDEFFGYRHNPEYDAHLEFTTYIDGAGIIILLFGIILAKTVYKSNK